MPRIYTESSSVVTLFLHQRDLTLFCLSPEIVGRLGMIAYMEDTLYVFKFHIHKPHTCEINIILNYTNNNLKWINCSPQCLCQGCFQQFPAQGTMKSSRQGKGSNQPWVGLQRHNMECAYSNLLLNWILFLFQ